MSYPCQGFFKKNIAALESFFQSLRLRSGIGKRNLLILILSLALLAVGCANPSIEPCLKDGRRYCITDEWIYSVTWYSCYLRGLSCVQGGCWENARDEFLGAVQKREQDERWVRTYGMHRLPEYFPNRELGIAYYHLHDLDNALAYLSISLKQCESGKAKYYLNKVRREILLHTREDKEAPQLFLDPDHRYHRIIATPGIDIRGQARDDTFVSNILIQVNNEVPVSLMELSQPHFQFNQRIFLRSGLNEVLIKAVDLLGKEAEQRISVLVDQEGPMIYFAKPEGDDPSSLISIHGLLSDPSGVNQFFLNGKRIELIRVGAEAGSEASYPIYSFHYHLSPDEQRKGILQYQAEDLLKNRTIGTTSMLQGEEEEVSGINHRPVQIAMAPYLFATEAGVNPPLIRIATGRQSLAPIRIKISRFPKETFEEDICPKIEILTSLTIREVSINEQPLLSIDGLNRSKLLSLTVKKYLGGSEEGRFLFQRMIKLKEGKNTIHFRVVDWSGKVWEESIMVMKKTKQIHQLKERWRIAIPFISDNHGGENPEQNKKGLTYKLIEAFISQARFKVIELEHLPMIIDEKKLGYYLGSPFLGLSSECRIFIDTFLLGYIQEAEDSLTLSASLVDLETGEILATKDVCEEVNPLEISWQEGLQEHTFQLCSILAAKFKEHFPLCEGRVISLTGDELKTGICQNDGLRKGMRLILYKSLSHEKDSDIVGEARVKEVEEEYSLATLLKKMENRNAGEASRYWEVITR